MPHLLDELERLLGRRRRLALAAGVLLPCTALLAGALVAGQRDSPCTRAAERTGNVWNDARRQDVRTAFTAVGKSFADEAGSRVVGQMDDYAQRWGAAYESVCELARKVEQPSGQLDRGMACLNDAMFEFEATARLLAAVDDIVAREAVQTVARLTDPSRCGSVADEDIVHSTDPASAPAIERIRQELAEVRTLTRAAKFDDARSRVRPLAEAAAEFPGTTIDAEARFMLASVLDLSGDMAEAEPAYFDAIEVAAAARHTAIESEAWVNLVRVATVTARYNDARRFLRQAEALLGRTGDERHEFALRMNRASLSLAQAEYDQAVADFESALELGERVLTPGDGRLAGILNNLGAVHGTRGDHERALDHFERAYAIKREALGDDHPDSATCMSNIAVTYERLGQNERALELYQKVVDIRARALGPEHADVGVALHNLGSIESNLGHLDEALALYERALTIKRATLGGDHPSTAVTESNIGDALVLKKRHAEAIAHLERAAETLRSKLGPDHPTLGFALFSLGEAELAMGRPERAIVVLEQTLALRVAREGDPADVAATHFALARALHATKEYTRARELAEAAEREYAALAPRSAAELAKVRAWLKKN